MNEGKEIKLLLKGLDCANCSMKIENKVNEFSEVSKAEINFVKSILKISVEDEATKDIVIEKVKKLVKQLEPHVQVIEMVGINENTISNNKSTCNGSCGKEDLSGDKHTHEHGNTHNNDEHEHSHELNYEKGLAGFAKEKWNLILGIIMYIAALLLKDKGTGFIALYFVSYALVGKDVLLTAIRNIFRGEIFDENFLMAVATIGAMAIGEYPEGIAVMIFYEVGEMFQGYAVGKSRKSIGELMNIRPDYANLLIDGLEKKVTPEQVNIGDLILVKPGERVPLDGEVEDGTSFVDTSALTGEAVPREVKIGESILAGVINKNSILKVRVNKSFKDSTVTRILELVENASSKKAKTEKFITKFAKVYTPIVVYLALAVAFIPPIFLGWDQFSTWFYRALLFLVISCPCALVVSVPLGMFAGIGGASKKGILIKGGNYLEALKDIDTVVFDKTGTLTKGVFKVTEIESINISKEELLEIAAICESKSNHPIAASIMNEYNKTIDDSIILQYEEIAGNGIKANTAKGLLLLGNNKLMASFNIKYEDIEAEGTVLHIAKDNDYLGYIIISDEIKENSESAIKELKAMGIKNIVMLTGDRKKVAEGIAKKLGIDKVYSELLPNDKVNKVEELLNEKNNVAFVGDGINDAPVLARANIGIAMGGIGSDAAIEAADVVLMKDDPLAIVSAIKAAKRTNKILWQNISFAIGIKVFVMILGAFGIATMWEAVFADVGVTILAVINSTRCLR